jgi:hypothetical protein
MNHDWYIELCVDASGSHMPPAAREGVLGGAGFAGFEAREAEVMLVTGTFVGADRGHPPQSVPQTVWTRKTSTPSRQPILE